MVNDARLDVYETVYRRAVGIDTKDFVLYRSVFASEVLIDFESYNGDPPATLTADRWVDTVRPLLCGLAATQHSLTNPLAR